VTPPDTSAGDTATLLAVPPAEFVAARTARAKELRADGDKEAAAIVAKLRRPSVTTWAVNAAVRANAQGAADLVDAVRTLQKPGSVDVRAATRTLDAALDALVDAASRALSAIGTRPTADRKAEVRSALRVAALADDPTAFLEARVENVDAADPDDTLAAALRAGAHGAGRARTSSPSPTNAAPAKQEPPLAELRAALTDARGDQKAARDAVRQAEREVRRIERELDTAQRTLDAARKDAERAEAAVEARQGELDEARGD
jgi:hypothetical protein